MTFGDTVAEKAYDHKPLGPIGDVPRVPGGLLYDILVELLRLHRGLRVMKCECLRLEAAGMWPAIGLATGRYRSLREIDDSRWKLLSSRLSKP